MKLMELYWVNLVLKITNIITEWARRCPEGPIPYKYWPLGYYQSVKIKHKTAIKMSYKMETSRTLFIIYGYTHARDCKGLLHHMMII